MAIVHPAPGARAARRDAQHGHALDSGRALEPVGQTHSVPIHERCVLVRVDDGDDLAFATGIHYGIPSLAPYAFTDPARAAEWLHEHGGGPDALAELSMPEAMDVLSKHYAVTGLSWEDRPGEAVAFANDLRDAGELWPTHAVAVGPSGLIAGDPFVSALTRRGRLEERSAADLVRWLPWDEIDFQWSDVIGDEPLFGCEDRLDLVELRFQGGQCRVDATEVLGPWSSSSGTRLLFTSESAARWWWQYRAPDHRLWIHYEPKRGNPGREGGVELVPVTSLAGLIEEDQPVGRPSLVINPDGPRGLTGYVTIAEGAPVLTSVSGEWAIAADHTATRASDSRVWSGFGTVHMPSAGGGSRLKLGSLGRSSALHPLGDATDELRNAAPSELGDAIADALTAEPRILGTGNLAELTNTFIIAGWDTVSGETFCPVAVDSFLDGLRWLLAADQHDRHLRVHGTDDHGRIGLSGSEDHVAEQLRSAALRRAAEGALRDLVHRGFRPSDADRMLAAANRVLRSIRLDAFGYLADTAFRADAAPEQLTLLTHPEAAWSADDLRRRHRGRARLAERPPPDPVRPRRGRQRPVGGAHRRERSRPLRRGGDWFWRRHLRRAGCRACRRRTPDHHRVRRREAFPSSRTRRITDRRTRDAHPCDGRRCFWESSMTDQLKERPGLVSVAEIAQIAGVTPAAVGNWRKRHPEFPLPAVQAPSGALFDLEQIEAWLLEKGKITTRVAASQRLWSVLDSVRDRWHPRELMSYLVALLVFLEARERSGHAGAGELVESGTPDSLLPEEWGGFVKRLRSAFADLEASDPALDGLLLPGLDQLPPSSQGDAGDDVIRLALLIGLVAAVDEVESRVSIFEEVVSRLARSDRFGAEFATPDDLSYLVTQIAGAAAHLFDPALGEGGLLLMAAVSNEDAESSHLVGVERNPDVARIARSRFYLYEVEAEVVVGDALAMGPSAFPKADLVLLDPPYGMREWGDADTYRDPAWRFGIPPARSSDLAWLQLAALTLAPEGRAYVVLPTGSLSRHGPERAIRERMLEAGAVEGVIQLPARLRPDTGISLALWILCAPGANAERDILLVDASDLGDPGRSQTTLPESTVDRLAGIVHGWRTSGTIDDDNLEVARAVPVADVFANGADLNPKRYQPAITVDEDRLLRTREGILARLPAPVNISRERFTPPDLPARRTSLNDVVQIIRPHRGGGITREPKGHHVLGGPEIRDQGNRYLRPEDDPNDYVTVERNDVVVALDADGGSFLVDDDWEGAVLAPDSAILRVTDPAVLTPGWLYAWTQSFDFRDQFSKSATGTTVVRVPFSALREFTVPVADLDHQTRTAGTMAIIEAELLKAQLLIRDLEELRGIEADLAIASGDDQ